MMGHGDHVVVIYGDGGALVRSLRLGDLVPAYFIDSLPTSVSSIHWHGGDAHFLADDRLELVVSGPIGEDYSADGSYPVVVSLADGSVDPLAPEIVAQVADRVCTLHRSTVDAFNGAIAFERGDLTPPLSGDDRDWDRFFHHAVKRMPLPPLPGEAADPHVGMLASEPFKLLADGEYMEADFRRGFRGALTAPAEELRRRLFASRDQVKMVREVQRATRRIKPGQLNGVQMVFLADSGHWPAIRDALAVSGASLIQIDIGIPIPPLAEEVAELPALRTVDPACADAGTD
jgi:hypothetical protein